MLRNVEKSRLTAGSSNKRNSDHPVAFFVELVVFSANWTRSVFLEGVFEVQAKQFSSVEASPLRTPLLLLW